MSHRYTEAQLQGILDNLCPDGVLLQQQAPPSHDQPFHRRNKDSDTRPFPHWQEMCAYPELTIQTDPSLHHRCNLCQAITSHFWRRWSQEYLQQMQKLHKWRQPTNNLQVGDIVVIRDDAAIHNQWPMAHILEVSPGKDGLVRVATLKTATTTLKRPIAKLALLLRDDQPISTTEPSSPTPSTSQKS